MNIALSAALLARFKRMASIISAIAIFSLAGCAGPTMHMVDPVSKDNQPEPGQGVVVARIIDASASDLPFNYLTLSPKELHQHEESKPYRLSRIERTPEASVTFASPVPAGEYSMSGIRAFYVDGDRWYGRGAAAGTEFGTFSVSAGEVTDLGVLVYYPKVEGEKYSDSLLRIPQSESLPIAKQVVNADIPTAGEASSWHDDGKNNERFSDYASAVQNPVTFNGRLRGPDGAVYFYGKLGAIMVRHANGEWDIDAVEADEDMHAMAINERGDMAIGGDLGSLFYKPYGGQWQRIPFSVDSSIRSLTFHEEGSIDVVAASYYEVTVHRLSLDGQVRETLRRYNAKEGWTDGDGKPQGLGVARERAPRMEPIGYVYTKNHLDRTHLVLSTRGYNNHNHFASHSRQVYEVSLPAWEVSRPEKSDPELDRVARAGEASVGIKEQTAFFASDR